MKFQASTLAVLFGFAVAGTALPAFSQPVPAGSDPIGDLLSGVAAGQGMDDDAAEAGDDDTPTPAGRVIDRPRPPASPYRQPAPLPGRPPVAQPPTDQSPRLDRPVMLDELWRTPEPPLNPTEQAYDSRIKGGFAAAQGRQGPLDGAWILRGPDGRGLFSLVLVDKGDGDRPLEGAWRNLGPSEGSGQVGLVESIERTGTGLSVRFKPRPGRPAVVVTLTPAGAGWAGEIWDAGQTRQVTLRRN